MKSITTKPDSEQAKQLVIRLRAQGIYGCISGCASLGYDVLVADGNLDRARAIEVAQSGIKR